MLSLCSLVRPMSVLLCDCYEQTSVDEVMLVTLGASRAVHTRTIELIAQHYGMVPAAV